MIELRLQQLLDKKEIYSSTRDLSDTDRASLLIAGAQGKRLVYSQPR